MYTFKSSLALVTHIYYYYDDNNNNNNIIKIITIIMVSGNLIETKVKLV